MRIIGGRVVKTPCDGLLEKYPELGGVCTIDEAWYRGQMRYLEQLSADLARRGDNVHDRYPDGERRR